MTASITNAIAGLVSFGASVPGVNGSYDLKTFFDAQAAGPVTLPVLLAVVELNNQSGYESLSMMGQGARLVFSMDHYLLYQKVGDSPDITLIMPSLIAVCDAYFAALRANPFLTGAAAPAYHATPKVPFKPAIKTLWNGVHYHSILFHYANVEINL